MTLPRPHEDVVSERLGDELVLVHLGTNEVFALNETGARFWELLVAGGSRAAIEERLLAEYDVGRRELAAEIDAILAELGRQKMVRAS
jgi:Coenzyme PQQ synthesis protein D (PqqD)